MPAADSGEEDAHKGRVKKSLPSQETQHPQSSLKAHEGRQSSRSHGHGTH